MNSYEMDKETWARMLVTLDQYRISHDVDCTCTPCMEQEVIARQVDRPAVDRWDFV